MASNDHFSPVGLTPEYLQELYNYNYWANRRVLSAAERLSPEQLKQKQAPSWGSVLAILIHMRNAEWIWLNRWMGNSPVAFPSFEQFPTLIALQQDWADVERQMMTFLTAQSADSLESEIEYTNTQGKTYQLRLWQMVVHLANHGTHHRGELAAIFSTVGVSHQEEDWLHYFLDRSGQRAA